MTASFRKSLAEEILLADGAMGTLLVTRGAEPSSARSSLNVVAPQTVSEIHEDYADAGVRILTTNTWDANRVKLREHDWADSLEKINREGVRLARAAASGEHIFVAASIGPLGAMVKPYGALSLSQVREIFEEQIRVLLEAGADLLLLESFGNLLEAAEAVRAARGLSPEIPIVAQMTFFGDGRTAFGERAADALHTLVSAGADAAGINCTLGPQETLEVFSQVASRVPAPLSVMPNAGYPTLIRGRNVYNASPDYFREYALEFVDKGAAIVGGCCGTTPEHTRAMALALAGASRRTLSLSSEAAPADAFPTVAGDRHRNVPLQAEALDAGVVHGHGRGRAAEGRRLLELRPGGEAAEGPRRRRGQRHRQPDGAPSHVVDRGGRPDPARDGRWSRSFNSRRATATSWGSSPTCSARPASA